MRDASTAFAGGPMLGKVIEEREGVGFATAELGGQIKDGARLGALAGEPADDLAGEGGEIPGQVGAGEEPVGLLVVRWGGAVAHVVQVDGEFGGVEGFGLTEVFAGCYDFVPRFEGHKGGSDLGNSFEFLATNYERRWRWVGLQLLFSAHLVKFGDFIAALALVVVLGIRIRFVDFLAT